MATKGKLHLEQHLKQQQTLAPVQLQFVRLLEMTGPEVEDEVMCQVDDNPALEIIEEEPSEQAEDQFAETAEELQKADYASDDDIPDYNLQARNHSADDEYFEPIAHASGESLFDNLNAQLSLLDIPEIDRAIATYIIGNIDDNGYLTRSASSIADDISFNTPLSVEVEDVRRMLKVVQSFEPAGIGAMDLRECLLLQLKRLDSTRKEIRVATEIVAHYFDLFSRLHYQRLKSQLNVDETVLKAALAIIRGLNPKPGSLISGGMESERSRHITPDFQVDYDAESDRITITSLSRIPSLQIEQSFKATMPTGNSRREAEAAAFIRRKHDDAATFISLLSRRQQTLLRIIRAIVGIQKQYFASGDSSKLQPMILKDISDITGDDLSVISRATTDKYISTRFGILPLKYFFNERREASADATTFQLEEAIREIIEKEDKRHPLSDAEIAQELDAMGIPTARRTVAKYRERLGFPVGRLRKTI